MSEEGEISKVRVRRVAFDLGISGFFRHLEFGIRHLPQLPRYVL